MSNRKFASITGSLLVRKGEALPSPASQRSATHDSLPDAWIGAGPHSASGHPATVPHAAEMNAPHRLTFRLDDDRYRRLCIASAQLQTPVQHLLTAALDGYLATLGENELAGCSCLKKSGCAPSATACDNLEKIRRPT